MKNRMLLLPGLLGLMCAKVSAQVKIGTNPAIINSASALEIEDSTRGLLIPRITTSKRLAIANPPQGLLVFDSNLKLFYYYRNTTWTAIPANSNATLQDTDGDTRVEVERNTNENLIRFTLGGTERWRMTAGRLENINSNGTLAIGSSAGRYDAGTTYNIYYGDNAGEMNVSGTYNTGIGIGVLKNNISGDNTGVGNKALFYTTTGGSNTAMGSLALALNRTGSGNVAIGVNALYSDTAGTGNVAIGNNAGAYATGSDKLYIENGSALQPLLYGDFANRSLVVNDSLASTYLKMTNSPVNGYIMQTDSQGNGSWVNAAGITTKANTLVQDTDGDTRVRTEASTNENKIRFSLGGTERWIMNGRLLEPVNTGASTLVGSQAGRNDDGSNRQNSYFGYETGYTNAVGAGNTGAGYRALYSNSGGQNNTALGAGAGLSNAAGSGNIFLGAAAGGNETGSNKLYIENTNSASPLIYGDFSTDSVRVNGSMSVAGTGGFVATGTFGSGNIPGSGSGIRMMWYPKKAAFRAGQAISNYWDDANTGSYSFATGQANRASGNGSAAMGYNNVASGSNSVAMGENLTAPAAYEIALGTYNALYSPTGTGTDHILSVGNGNFNASSNALTVLRNGNTGINTDAPGSTLTVNGSIGIKRTGVSATYTAGATDYLIAVTTTSAVTINLPPAATAETGRTYLIKAETTAAPNITLDASGSETIDGSLTKIITTAAGVLRIYCNGTSWWTF